ncbi:hypothetical protein LWI28_013628 [Acer negundo]|uniref:Protein phosphatase n=1 Tax=Acer negundo TaxID=4023 RepID=A0AAD5NLQ0_ACENE|nr:hypothetical protein LWI28_013628 [Acer negundo]
MIKFKPRNRKTSMKKSCSSAHLQHSCDMIMGSFYLPKRTRKSRRCGQDAHFLCREKLTLGVADGVGGWLKKGIDSGKYSRELLKNSVAALDLENRGSANLRRVLEEAFCMTKSEGSSTPCIITLRDDDHDHEHCLNALNVGDSGFMLFRNNKCKFKSSSQQHRFNQPYQLGNFNYGDGPDIATEIVVPVESGDVVVAGTDGLLDNMFPYEIEEILSRTQDDKNVAKLAKTVAKYASYNATDRYSDSLFSRARKLAGNKPRLGGKIDDISVVVAKII